MTEATFLMLCKSLLNTDTGITETAYHQLWNIASDLQYDSVMSYLLEVDCTNGMFYMPEDYSYLSRMGV